MTPLQSKVRSFVHDNQLSTSVETRLLDAVSELGELAKEALRSSKYGKQPFTSSPAFADELGDVLFSLICVANEASVDVTQAIESALARYEGRIRASGTASSPNQTLEPTSFTASNS